MKYYRGCKERIGFDFYADIAVRIVQAREEKGMTQKQLSDTIKWKAGRLSSIEAVKRRINLDDLEDLSKALDVTINWLLEAHDDSPIGKCRYLVTTDAVPDMSLYVDASNARTAVFELERNFKKAKVRLWSNSRDRAFVQLVGIPVDKNRLKDRFGKYTDNCPLERNPEE